MVKQMFSSCQWTATSLETDTPTLKAQAPRPYRATHVCSWLSASFPRHGTCVTMLLRIGNLDLPSLQGHFLVCSCRQYLPIHSYFRKSIWYFFRCHRVMSTPLPLFWWIGHLGYHWVLVPCSLGHSPICSVQGLWDESICRALASSSPGRCSSFCLRATAAQFIPHSSSLLVCFTIPWAWASGFPVVTLHSFGFCLPALSFSAQTLHCFSLPL